MAMVDMEDTEGMVVMEEVMEVMVDTGVKCP